MKLQATLATFVAVLSLLSAAPAPADEPQEAGKTNAGWRPLFDGESLTGWKVTPFGGEGEVYVEDGRLVLDFGSSMTGITYQKPFPKSNYEIRYEAMRMEGNDFFCGITFPVGESFCSLIAGGWGGTVVGLSSIDGRDASENSTGQFKNFENGRWYKFRVRVTDQHIQAWIDEEQVIDEEIAGKKFSTRVEVDLNKPLGFATWETRGALRKIEYRMLEKKKPTK